MKISVIAPVKNEFPWIGYSIMAAMPYVYEFVYAVSPNTDGTDKLLDYLQLKFRGKIRAIRFKDFDPLDQKSYNEAFNLCIQDSVGDVCWFLHPDMIVTKGAQLQEGPLAWWINVVSFAGDMETKILRGRANRWKNIHANKFGLHYAGGYGSQNEDFYHSQITGTSYKHYGLDFDKYPFEVADSGISVNHYCEVKDYKRRLEKMKICLRTQYPHYDDHVIDDLASRHQRVTLEEIGSDGIKYEYGKSSDFIPEVITKYKAEFEAVR